MKQTTFFVDHSFLRKASGGQFSSEIRVVKDLIRVDKVRFVASGIHLLEIAKYSNPESNIQEARLIDSLGPLWLRDRLDLVGEELRNALEKRARP